jgi:2-amino-4-hydroxy-6-hydroxymethyldihydropteridine diphosphokinase
MTEVYIGLGANEGDAVQQILNAKQLLRQRFGSERFLMSSLFLSAPQGYTDQPHFVNSVLRLSVQKTALELLLIVQEVELSLGRVRDPDNRNAPRIIDLDLLLFGNQTIDTPKLTLPHPRMYERRFVLEPLKQVLNHQHPCAAQVVYGCESLSESLDQELHVIEC